jgi:hypothetical protein
MKVSGFTFGYNLVSGGYPFVEAIKAVQPYVDEMVAVDIASTDNTRKIFSSLGCKVLDGKLCGTNTTSESFKLHVQCSGDVIIFFEADEVFDDRLLQTIRELIDKWNATEIAVHRLQVTQNFQRCSWYPIPVYRVFKNGDMSYCEHPTNLPNKFVDILGPQYGYLWDCSNIFRDNWKQRKENQVKLFGNRNLYYVPEHFRELSEFQNEEEEKEYLSKPHWTWKETPFDIPKILKHLVGKTIYPATI